MKKLINRMKSTLIFVFGILSVTAYSQTGITFTIEELSKPEKLLSMKSDREIYEDLILLEISANQNSVRRDKFPFGIIAKSDLSENLVSFQNSVKMDEFPFGIIAKNDLSDKLVSFGYHSFFNGVYQAYSDHRPIVLSPDMIWLLISQGFARHVSANSEGLRHHFVDFSEKITLMVVTEEITLDDPQSPWEKIFPELTQQIAEHTGKEIIDLLSADFSTTTPVEKVASEITILEALKSYFEYIVLYVVCGIPEVTLKGTTDDWQKILDRTRQLGKYDLTWWTDELEPILEEFVKASKGQIDREFWKDIFINRTVNPSCGPTVTVIDGWFVKFFPYNNKGSRNNLKSISNSNDLPEEIVKVDLQYYDDETGITTPLELWAGFIGLDQNEMNYALTPKIGWMIRRKDVEQAGLQHKYEYELERTGQLRIRVKEIPEAIYALKEIKSLSIQFIDSIVIPDRLAELKIDKFFLEGRVSRAEKERIRQLFPNTIFMFDWDYFDVSIETITIDKKQPNLLVVKGKVTNADTNEPIRNVAVQAKGTTNGTLTDTNGIFFITVEEGTTLVFRYVRYDEFEMIVSKEMIDK